MTLLQSNYYLGSYKRFLEWILKITITLLCVWFIYRKVEVQHFTLAKELFQPRFFLLILLNIFLMMVNWWLEAEKWRISNPEEKLSFAASLQVVLRGLAMNWVIPFTLGDVGGRLIRVVNQKKAIYALFVNRSVMMLITTIYGLIAVLFYYHRLNSTSFLSVILGVVTTIIIYTLINQKKIGGNMPIKLFKTILGLSLLRYFVFSFQFYLLLVFFNPTLSSLVVILGIGWIFLFRSFIPSIFGNFGVREASAIAFFHQYQPDSGAILIPCIIIWLINTVLPSVCGAFAIINFKVNIA